MQNGPLYDHIHRMQTLASQANALLDAVLHLDNEGACKDGQLAILQQVERMTAELENGLDSASLRKAAA